MARELHRIHARFQGTTTYRRYRRNVTIANTMNRTASTVEEARKAAKGFAAMDGCEFVKVSLKDGRDFCWTPERGWWQKEG